jgi:putative oxidoreductase
MSVVSVTAHAPRRIAVWVLQAIVAAAFFAAGGAKLAGAPFMVQLFAQIGIGQWFRHVTGAVEIIGAFALITPRLSSVGGLWLGATMLGAVTAHLFVLHTNPAPAIVLGLLSVTIIYLRRDELASIWRAISQQS